MVADAVVILSAIGLAALGFIVIVVVCVVVLRLITVVLPGPHAETSDIEQEPTDEETPGEPG
jgi:hypothetical protein